jgi:thioredoxin-dependent peroxiredoxin
MGVQRATFLIKDGLVQKAWPKVKPEGHAAEVLEALKTI